MSTRLFVTGLGAVTPLGVGVDALWEETVNGRSGIASGLGECRFDLSEHLSRREARRMDRFSQLAVIAAQEAVAEAGWDDGMDTSRIGCIVGTAIGGLETIERQFGEHLLPQSGQVSPLAVPMLMANAAPAQIALRYGYHGQTAAVVSACAAGAQAVVDGARILRSGECDAVIVGGAEAANTSFTRAMFTSAGALSPTGRSRPFHARRDGFVLGEGAGMLVLETEESLRRRKGRALAELKSWGTSTDAHHLTAPEPSGTHAAAALRGALDSGGIRPSSIGYLNAHGTGTVLNDCTEALALRAVFGPELGGIPVSSTKSVMGHLLGAAGAVEAVVSILALARGMVPPTAGLDEVDPGLDDLMLIREALPWEPKRSVAISNSMGFGGHNVALAFSRVAGEGL